jgi:hypothetical protein
LRDGNLAADILEGYGDILFLASLAWFVGEGDVDLKGVGDGVDNGLGHDGKAYAYDVLRSIMFQYVLFTKGFNCTQSTEELDFCLEENEIMRFLNLCSCGAGTSIYIIK